MSSTSTGIALAIVFALLGCTSEVPASVQGGSVVRPNPDATGDGSAETAFAPPVAPYSPGAAGLCAGAPAALGGAVVWVDEAGLWLVPHEEASSTTPVLVDTFPAGASPRSPLVLKAYNDDMPAIAVAVAFASTCELRFYQRSGDLLGVVEAATKQCTNPSGGGRYLAWPLGPAADDDADTEGRVAWVDAEELREVTSLPLGGTPLTPAAAFGPELASGGGSHWLVGTTRGVVAIEDPLGDGRLGRPNPAPDPVAAPPRVIGSWEPPSGRVTSIVVAGDHALVTLADVGETGLGRRMQALHIDASPDPVLSSVGLPIVAPGRLTVHPVAFDCELAGASSWYCPRYVEATVVVGGEGWLAGWHLPSGEQAFEREVPITWTGLSLGRAGWLAGGGSHWLPGDELVPEAWRLVALDPALPEVAETELAAGAGARCVPSPLWDSDGLLAVPVLGRATTELVRGLIPGVAGPLGLARGSARPLGNPRNGGTSVDDSSVCGDGEQRGLNALAPEEGDVYGIAYGGGRAVLFGNRNEHGFIRWLPDTRPGVHVDLPEARAIERAVVLPDDVVVTVFFDSIGTGLVRVAAFRHGTPAIWNHPLSMELGNTMGIVPAAPGEYIVAERVPAGDRLVRVSGEVGELDARFIAPDEPSGLKVLRSDGAGGAIMVLALETSIVVRRVDSALVPFGRVSWERAGRYAMPVDANVDGGGHLRVMVETGIRGTADFSVHWLHYDRDLSLVDERLIPYYGWFATQADGTSLIASPVGLVRVSATGAVGLPMPFGRELDGELIPGLRAVAATETGFVVGYARGGSAAREYLWGHSDVSGFVGCSAAGLCLGQDPSACDIDAQCVARGCAPATGTCEVALPGVAPPNVPVCAP